jgi:hypothetical protein
MVCPYLFKAFLVSDDVFADESLDSALFSWPYEDSNSYDPSFLFSAESSSTQYSPAVSSISYSPRSDRTGMTSLPAQ